MPGELDDDAARRVRRRAGRLEPAASSRARTPTPRTCGSGDGAPRSTRCWPSRPCAGEGAAGEPTRFGALALGGCGRRCSRPSGCGTARDAPFDIRGPLPTGTTVLEASAGTGKTHTIGALVTRYVAEGRATLDQLLVVTFGRAASQELRERVRDQLVAAERALADPAAARTGADRRAAAAGGRRRRGGRPAGGAGCAPRWPQFDAATIATTHQFCQQVLTGLGVAGDGDAGRRPWSRTWTTWSSRSSTTCTCASSPGRTPTSRSSTRPTALAAGPRRRSTTRRPGWSRRTPTRQPGRRPASVRARRPRWRSTGANAGADCSATTTCSAGWPRRSSPADAAARDRMRARWSVVLVDEFQDTDPVQWEVLRPRLRRPRARWC